MGGKFKLLEQIISKFPDDINTFVDLFGGGFNVGVNIKANKIIYNDSCKQVMYLLNKLYNLPLNEGLNYIDSLIEKFSLTKENKEGFANLRNYYNDECKDPLVFYTLICFAFNNQIRFNLSGEYNIPFGKDRSFNPTLRQKYCDFVQALQQLNCSFTCNDFRSLKPQKLKQNDFVYCDPPYLNTVAVYNENGGWTCKDEDELRHLLTDLNNNQIRFGLSNDASTNTTLIPWAEDNGFIVNHLNISYNNCNYHKKNDRQNDEVYITNFKN